MDRLNDWDAQERQQASYRSAYEMMPTPPRYNAPAPRRINYVGNHAGDSRLSSDHELFLTRFLKFLGLLPIRSRPTSVIAFKTIYIDYHLRNPMRKMSPSLTIRTLSIHFKAINKTRQQDIVYLQRFDVYKPQLGEIQGSSAVTAADLDLLNNKKEDLERNRNGAWVSSTYDEMLTMLDHPSTIAFDDSILHLNQEDNHMYYYQLYL